MNTNFVNKRLQTSSQIFCLLYVVCQVFFLAGCDYKIFVDLTPSSGTAFSIRGMVNGLTAGDVLVLQNNGVDNTTINATGTGTLHFSFHTAVANNATYNVTVLTQPPAKNCDAITGGFGTVRNSDVIDIVITCVAGPYSVGGTVTGLPNAAYSVTFLFTYTNPLQAPVVIYPLIPGNAGLPVSFVSSPILSPNATYSAAVWSTSANLACGPITNGAGSIVNVNKNDMSLNCGVCGNGTPMVPKPAMMAI